MAQNSRQRKHPRAAGFGQGHWPWADLAQRKDLGGCAITLHGGDATPGCMIPANHGQLLRLSCRRSDMLQLGVPPSDGSAPPSLPTAVGGLTSLRPSSGPLPSRLSSRRRGVTPRRSRCIKRGRRYPVRTPAARRPAKRRSAGGLSCRCTSTQQVALRSHMQVGLGGVPPSSSVSATRPGPRPGEHTAPSLRSVCSSSYSVYSPKPPLPPHRPPSSPSPRRNPELESSLPTPAIPGPVDQACSVEGRPHNLAEAAGISTPGAVLIEPTP